MLTEPRIDLRRREGVGARKNQFPDAVYLLENSGHTEIRKALSPSKRQLLYLQVHSLIACRGGIPQNRLNNRLIARNQFEVSWTTD